MSRVISKCEAAYLIESGTVKAPVPHFTIHESLISESGHEEIPLEISRPLAQDLSTYIQKCRRLHHHLKAIYDLTGIDLTLPPRLSAFCGKAGLASFLTSHPRPTE